jgi:hypothetical protein
MRERCLRFKSGMGIMKLLWIGIAAVATAAGAQTNQATTVRVMGDRVSLRAKPSLEGELLDRAMRGEEMVFFEKTNGWVAVQAPESLSFWVSGDYVQNGIVQPAKLNVRSGPSLNYNVVAIVKGGDKLTLRGEFNNWLKIAPPVGSSVWISEDYVEIIEPPKPEPEPELEIEPEPEPAPEPAPEIEPDDEELEPLLLVLDKDRKQGVYDEMPGILRRANPGLYKLVVKIDGKEETVCLVRGKQEQMEKYLNRSMLIKGRKYWAENVALPIIQPVKIHLDPIL